MCGGSFEGSKLQFSLEMTKEQLTNRILSSEAGIDSQAFRTGALRAEDWEYLALATAVSYTHLDVYKRQGLVSAPAWR